MKKLKVKKLDEVEKTGNGIRLKPGAKVARARHKDDLTILSRGSLKLEDITAILVHLLQRVEYLEGE